MTRRSRYGVTTAKLGLSVPVDLYAAIQRLATQSGLPVARVVINILAERLEFTLPPMPPSRGRYVKKTDRVITRKPWSPEEMELLDTMPPAELAAKLGRTIKSVYDMRLRTCGAVQEHPCPAGVTERRARAAEMRAAGMSVGDIAASIGVTRQTVYRLLRDAAPLEKS